ncbi:MAG: hypothetical protein H7122_08945 [Chitinophagaceae bacterium]|nr:hypothetical protein [Chitinophagaceae bacterium]
MKQKVGFRTIIILGCIALSSLSLQAQSVLDRNVSIEVSRQRLENVLEILSNKGNFFFSYNSNIIRSDSLVSLNMSNRTIREVLVALFSNGYEFRESGNYIILRRSPIQLRLVTNQAVSEDKFYTVSGYVIDDQTGEKVSDASIYEKLRLTYASTNNQGYFKIRLKSRYKTAAITVSKQFYEDTTVIIEPKYNQSVNITIVPAEISDHTITIRPQNYKAPESIQLQVPIDDSTRWLYTYIKKDSVLVERTALGRWLVSSKQRIQSINLSKFFTVRPVQGSIVPGLSTNGRLNSQVINNFSFNLFGGYSGGVNGFEIGGLFNIDKKNVQYVQLGGLFNSVGGSVRGVQMAGLSNAVLDSLRGAQLGGITNYVRKNFGGLQMGGIYNHVGGNLKGWQLAGITNFTNHKTQGAQIAGIANISSREINGVQIAGIFNYTRRLKGVQIGLINVSDSSTGYSIGLINIVFKGYHKLSLSTNEVLQVNAAFKTGSSKLYSILLAGVNADTNKKAYSFGYGFGSEFFLSKRFAINTELSSQYLYLGSWDYLNLQNKINLYLTVKFGKYFSIYGGPTYSVYVSNQDVPVAGYKTNIPLTALRQHEFSKNITGWFGWTAGINLF